MRMISQSHNMCLAHPNKKFWNWGPLFFSSFFFFPLLGNWQELGVIDIIAQLTIYALFVVLYGIALYKKGESVTPSLVAMALLCCLGTYLTYGTHSLFGFIGFFCGFNYRLKQSLVMMAALLLVILMSAFLFVPVKALYFISPAAVVSIGLFIFGIMEQRERVYRDQQARDQQQIEQLGAIAERERIARDLHDLLGHSLSSIALKAELASKLTLADQGDKAATESAEVASIARELLSEVRQAVAGLKQVGLYAQLESLEKRLQDAEFIVHTQIDKLPLSPEVESGLCFIAKEAVTNILRHSKGRQVTIKLCCESGYIEFMIQDDGQTARVTHGNGLSGIKERVFALGGEFILDTHSGFSITIRIKE